MILAGHQRLRAIHLVGEQAARAKQLAERFEPGSDRNAIQAASAAGYRTDAEVWDAVLQLVLESGEQG